jgi:hypothetical protein
MNAMRIAAAKVLGLFVDDIYFTAAILAWVACARLLLPILIADSAWDAAALALGCVLLLVGSTVLHAIRARQAL